MDSWPHRLSQLTLPLAYTVKRNAGCSGIAGGTSIVVEYNAAGVGRLQRGVSLADL
jgi:hypothetical protein